MKDKLYREAEKKFLSLKESASNKGISLPVEEDKLRHVLMFSNFVYKVLMKDPEILVDLVQSKDLTKSYEKEEYKNKLSKLDLEEDEKVLTKEIRNIRKREMVRIAWRDLTEESDTISTIKELSFFAEACIDKSVELFYKIYSKKYGTPIGAKTNQPQQLVVIGLGKLGGEELNFSSDIDIMFSYPEAGSTYSKVSNEEFFSLIARKIIRFLSEPTEDGFVFRVDTRLRPFGKSGAIVMGFDAMEDYYQSYGREWERYALIKARIVGGDRKRGEELLSRLRPFVYRRYLDYTVFDSLREMKQRIMNEAARLSILDNIKIGPGGIREIEFFVQVFQLIRGGIEPELQVQSLLKAIEILKRKSYVPEKVCDRLKEAYIFLRKLENRIQEYNDLQSHSIPYDPIQRLRIALSMGYESWDEFFNQLLDHTRYVHDQFEQLLAPKPSLKIRSDPLYSIFDKDEDEVKEMLLSMGFSDAQSIARIILDLKESSSFKVMHPKAVDILKRLMAAILKRLSKEENAKEVLLRLTSLIKNILLRTSYLSLMLENPAVVDHLIRLAKESSWIISFVSKFPVLLDELIDPRNLYTPPTREDLEKDKEYRLSLADPDDPESQMIQLSLLRNTNTLRVAASDITGVISVKDVSSYLTNIAEVVLEAAMAFAWKNCQKKSSIKHIAEGKGFCIIGYGKLGGRELSYSSDLDLIFLHCGKSPDEMSFYTKVAQQIIYLLTTHTIMGKAYEVDTRLRPDGSSGVLAVSVESFREYQIKRAWTWEHQALLRARPVCGDKNISEEFEEIRYEVLTKQRDPKKLFKEVWDMRQKLISQLSRKVAGLFHLKNDPGGLIDIEFIIQFLTLLHASSYPELIKWRAHLHFLNELERLGLINKDDASLLKTAYIEMRYTMHRLSLQEEKPLVKEVRFKEMREKVLNIWERLSKDFLSTNDSDKDQVR